MWFERFVYACRIVLFFLGIPWSIFLRLLPIEVFVLAFTGGFFAPEIITRGSGWWPVWGIATDSVVFVIVVYIGCNWDPPDEIWGPTWPRWPAVVPSAPLVVEQAGLPLFVSLPPEQVAAALLWLSPRFFTLDYWVTGGAREPLDNLGRMLAAPDRGHWVSFHVDPRHHSEARDWLKPERLGGFIHLRAMTLPGNIVRTSQERYLADKPGCLLTLSLEAIPIEAYGPLRPYTYHFQRGSTPPWVWDSRFERSENGWRQLVAEYHRLLDEHIVSERLFAGPLGWQSMHAERTSHQAVGTALILPTTAVQYCRVRTPLEVFARWQTVQVVQTSQKAAAVRAATAQATAGTIIGRAIRKVEGKDGD